MSDITDEMIAKAARAVRSRLERVLEFQIPFEDPGYMEVRKAEHLRERERARRLAGKSVTAPATERIGL